MALQQQEIINLGKIPFMEKMVMTQFGDMKEMMLFMEGVGTMLFMEEMEVILLYILDKIIII